ncbi:MAG: GNAT family N-acetyltransferase [Sphingomonas bacterium]|nr:GNAT family N-acetyltransferase [Sphingomonas bacterium]
MATRSITLRTGDVRDIATLDALMSASFDPRFGEAWTRNQCMGVLAMPGITLTLALIDDVPAGFALVRTVTDEAELLLLGVAPTQRRSGIGAALLRAVASDCAARGVTDFHLEVRANNEAISLYTAHGFTKVGERRDYYRSKDGKSYDAHTYRKALDAY